ncbi:Phospho-N-acetylmuramoyl-pentapeptide-transferase [bioreactor metagenome]|uniref:Phospho-N-acetylmuramoyl-pentapeptide-transferase n=1 Tax=bioreactor metagenome TaxID=1076179 RepID=A0A645FDR9_9ZZZZ
MGGLFIISGTLAAFLIFGLPVVIIKQSFAVLYIFIFMFLNGAIGFIDDYVKFVKKQNKGLNIIQKLILQFAVAASFLFAMASGGHITTSIRIPFTDVSYDLGMYYWLFSILFIVYVVNSVNLTDGLDGLAGSVTLIYMILFTAVAFTTLSEYSDANLTKLTILGGLCGGIIGFLCYNIYPAKIFMGDTGSLFLGGAVAGVAYWFGNPLIIIVAGFIFMLESVSVVLQVASFKITGKRIFKMAPIHHHFEMSGWHEKKIVRIFAAVTAVLCAVSYLGF